MSNYNQTILNFLSKNPSTEEIDKFVEREAQRIVSEIQRQGGAYDEK